MDPSFFNRTIVYYGADDPVEQFPLITSPPFVASVMVSYLLFVKVIGPKFMANKKPYDLKLPMLFYNFTMVVVNILLICEYVDTYRDYSLFGYSYFWKFSCHPLEKSTNPLMIPFLTGAFHYYLSKLLDLVDTVFFVLRKKDSHMSFLHLYHHTSMVFSTWFTMYMVREEIGAALGLINALVHVIMYAYYFLAALGPKVQKYLWWKRYITQIQIVQFLIVIATIARLSTNNCDLHPLFTYMWGTNVAIFLGLFINFYIKAYTKK